MPVAATVAICTWNRAALLDRTLAGMRELRIPPGTEWELLVVDNNCTDGTERVIEGHRRGTLPVRRVFQPTPGKSHAANLALAEARGDLIAWTDDDVLVDPGWLESLLAAAARRPEAVAFGGPIEPWFPFEPDPVLMSVFPSLRGGFCGLDLGPEERELGPDEYYYGANMAFRMAGLRDLRFDTKLGRSGNFQGTHEDKAYLDAVRAAGGRAAWVPGMRLKHYVEPSRISARYLGAYYYGIGRTDALYTGASVADGPRWFGAPRYLYRLLAGCYLRHLAARLRGNRKAALEHYRSYHYHRGVMGAFRVAGAARAAPSALPTGEAHHA